MDTHATPSPPSAGAMPGLIGSVAADLVQYPGLLGSVAADLATMRLLARAARALFPAIRLSWLIEELAKKLEVELDFRNEIRNSDRFREVLDAAGEAGRVRVPALNRELCTSKVLVMEWIAGCKITDVEALQRQARVCACAVGRGPTVRQGHQRMVVVVVVVVAVAVAGMQG
ncbi:putative aarF domain-containing protein kinase 1 [Tetrabaena socialis]|uniref:Putative aarF domain-containing protein kinase 1 n=1 Tax=Tetrabaena socialis TaxID=47790 RepID=A0A2J7ZJ62_9CHLO|nr:putative aarF domain-containing protein kinase 1 [Tetrabaena socialis]|eukprot:PNH00311.1 putative aarF domain-containing protein kinase 1 [Tetrabaena socialis]